MTVAPIALFAFNRPRHLKKTIDALAANSLALDSELYVFSDAPRSQDDYKLVEEVRHLIQNITGFKKVVPVFRAKNFGLADSITDGVTFLMKEYGKTIVVEDDIVTSPNFLEYMNSALDLYENHEKVMHIAAYLPPIKSNDLPETFFLNQTSCWGWASWARAWKHFSRDIKNIKEFYNSQKVHEFNLNGAYDYWSQLLANEQGTLKTWAVYWYAHVFAHGGLCLHPRDSLVQNIGFDGSGQHCELNPQLSCEYSKERIKKFSKPNDELENHKLAQMRFNHYFKVLKKKKLLSNKNISLLLSYIKRFTKMKFFFRWIDKKIRESRDITPPCCIINQGSKLLPTSRIINPLSKPENIVVGMNCFILGELFTFAHGGKIQMGDYCYLGEGSRIWSAKNIIIGNRVLISHNVNIFDSDTHPIDDHLARHEQFKEIIFKGHPQNISLNEKPVFIDDDALIACNSSILKGVCIGKGAVVGAGSVVVNDVPPFTVVAGNPAKIIRKISQV